MDAKSAAVHKELSWVKPVQFVIAVVFAFSYISLGLPQIFTGPVVNALLLIVAMRIGLGPAIFLGMMTPVAAFLSRVLPISLVLMLPFIMLGNAIFVSVFKAMSKKMNKPLSLAIAASAKFALLYTSVLVLVYKPLTIVIGTAPQAVSVPGFVLNMMGYMQIITALIGGSAAIAILSVLDSKKK